MYKLFLLCSTNQGSTTCCLSPLAIFYPKNAYVLFLRHSRQKCRSPRFLEQNSYFQPSCNKNALFAGLLSSALSPQSSVFIACENQKLKKSSFAANQLTNSCATLLQTLYCINLISLKWSHIEIQLIIFQLFAADDATLDQYVNTCDKHGQPTRRHDG